MTRHKRDLLSLVLSLVVHYGVPYPNLYEGPEKKTSQILTGLTREGVECIELVIEVILVRVLELETDPGWSEL